MQGKFRFIAGTVIFCILFTGYRMLFGKGSVFASQENCLVEASQDQGEAAWQDSEGNWQTGSLTEAVASVSSKGTVVLLSDVSLTSGITISKPVVITSNEADQPCTIKNEEPDTDDRKDRGRIFTVTSGELQLQNIILDGGRDAGVTAFHPLVCVNGNDAYLRMLEGAVLQNAENASQGTGGGGINIRKGKGSLHDGSLIQNCKARHGGGIEFNSSTGHYGQVQFILYGGCIKDCEAENGGGVYVNIGIFQMGGGEITGNRAMKADTEERRMGGGAIYVAGGSSPPAMAVVGILGGKITDNTAVSNGGGVLVQGSCAQIDIYKGVFEKNKAKCGGGVSVLKGTLKLYGGTITKNEAEMYGGGILGCPYGVIELKENPKVFDNQAGDETDRFDNFYLDGNEDKKTVPIRLVGALTDGVKLGMSRWIRPDENEHPYGEMIVPDGYEISQSDFDRLCDDRESSHKELYADNMEKYALIPHNGKIVMVRAVGITLDQDSISLDKAEDTAALKAFIKPDNAPVKEVTWSSSDEKVATVDEDGVVTAVGRGKARITATTVSPYHEKASCKVTVGKFYYQLTTRAAHGEILPTSDEGGIVEEKERVAFRLVPDKGYQLKAGSLRACRTDDERVPDRKSVV